MKKVASFLIAIIFCITAVIPSFAETVDLKEYISSAKKYLEENAKEATDFNDTISFAEAGLVNDIMKIYTITPDEQNALSLAEYILLQRAFGKDAKISESPSEDYGDALLKLQQEDGGFSDIKTTVYSVAALLSLKKDEKKGESPAKITAAVNYIIKMQSENGEIGDIETSAAATGILYKYKNSAEASGALTKLISYFNSFSESDDIKTLSVSLAGLTDANYQTTTDEMSAIIDKILEYRNGDGGFSSEKGGKSDVESTKYAFMALESVRYTVSPINALLNGISFSSSGIDLTQFYPLFILYGVMALCSVGLWIFIFKRKPRTGTLDDSKKASEEKFANVKKLSDEDGAQEDKS